MCVSVFFTMVLAFERFRAVCRPVEYYNAVNSNSHPWCTVVLFYVTPVVVVSILFNAPKFFETQFIEMVILPDGQPLSKEVFLNTTAGEVMSIVGFRLKYKKVGGKCVFVCIITYLIMYLIYFYSLWWSMTPDGNCIQLPLEVITITFCGITTWLGDSTTILLFTFAEEFVYIFLSYIL